jgi:hypothetical protein
VGVVEVHMDEVARCLTFHYTRFLRTDVEAEW